MPHGRFSTGLRAHRPHLLLAYVQNTFAPGPHVHVLLRTLMPALKSPERSQVDALALDKGFKGTDKGLSHGSNKCERRDRLLAILRKEPARSTGRLHPMGVYVHLQPLSSSDFQGNLLPNHTAFIAPCLYGTYRCLRQRYWHASQRLCPIHKLRTLQR